MRVKVGDTWYDSKEVPICLELEDKDKLNISRMFIHYPQSKKYASFPDKWGSEDEMKEWMKDGT